MKELSDEEKAARRSALRLTPVRVRLAKEVIAEVRDYRGGANGCDDYELPPYVTKAERKALIVDYHTWNGDPEEAVHGMQLGWGSLFGYLTEALLKHAGETVEAVSS